LALFENEVATNYFNVSMDLFNYPIKYYEFSCGKRIREIFAHFLSFKDLSSQEDAILEIA